MNEMNEVPIVHGLNLSQILQVVGSQILMINALELQIKYLQFKCAGLEKELAKAYQNGRLESSDSN